MKFIQSAKKKLRPSHFYILAFLIIATGSLYVYVSKADSKTDQRINPAFAAYISAYASGTISKESVIRIQLADHFGDSSRTGSEADVFSFEPDIEGKAIWVDASTIEFKPAKPLSSGQEYEAVFHLSELIDVPDELEDFPFTFAAIRQSFEVQEPVFESMSKSQLVYQRVSGTLLTADVDEDKKIERLLTATYNQKKLSVKWEHAADRRTHLYRIDSVERLEKASIVIITWNGTPLDIDQKGAHKLQIPALGDFKVMGMTVQNEGEQYVSIYFSDPLSGNQDLNGLITITRGNGTAKEENPVEPRFTISGNEIKCYPGARLTGLNTVQVHAGIKNSMGYPLPKGIQQELDFADVLPYVKMIGKGVILPSGNKLMIPFEAVSLRAVDISVVKVYENNVAQFLQVNDLSGNNELWRVGRKIIKKQIRLDGDKLTDLHRPNRFALQLDKLIQTEPGAVYHLIFTFKKEYSVYRCEAPSGEANAVDEDMKVLDADDWDSNQEGEASYWDYEENYYGKNYNWNERDDPCTDSYFNPERWATRNILASDIGLLAKQGSNNTFFFSANDIRTTRPLANVTLSILDLQQQQIASLQTDVNGWATARLPRRPYLLVAKHGNQRGYLRVDDPMALSLSRFDVSGDIVQKGLKGFIYGDRGVWRPGDSLYLTFILEDRNKTLPETHPVSFDLYTPQGVLYKRMQGLNPLNGFYSFHVATEPDAPTGNWTAKIKAGGAEFQKTLKIETVMPNRLKISLDFGRPYLEKTKKLSGTLESRWLHGAIADGLEAKVDLTLTPATTTFPRYPDYVFDDPERKFSPETETVFEGKLDENGKARIEADVEVENRAAGMLNANFVTKVFEEGGNFSIDRFTIPFHPYDAYLGIRVPKGDKMRGMLLTDVDHTVNIVAVRPSGILNKEDRSVHVQLYKINWRWWWDQSDDDENAYAENEDYELMQEDDVQLKDGAGTWKLQLEYPEWGRFLLRVTDGKEGHSTGKILYIDWPGWAGRAQRDNPQEATMLTFTSDKTTYKVGETASVTIPSSQGGRALVSVETGSRVVQTFWAETKQKQTRFSFKVTKDMLPNAYIHVSLLQPHAQTVNDLPIRLYGVIPITVEDQTTILKPIISMPDQLRPEETSTIRVSEATGKPMTYTLALVDEGLLDLTRFKTPDPHQHFYAREALGVKTWDIYDFVIGTFGIQLSRILNLGGDEGINRKTKEAKSNRFKPVVKFLGPFYLPAGQTASHRITLPPYVGSVKVMLVAGDKGAYGSAEKVVPVKKPVMVLATLPRVLGPGETVKLPVTVFALENQVKKVRVSVQASSILQPVGSLTKEVLFSKPGNEVVTFDFKVKKALGQAKVNVIATGANDRAEYAIELDVRNPNPYITRIYEGTPEKGTSWTTAYELPGMSSTNTATLEVSSIFPINLEKRMDYLIQYPYGCVEQTTSSVFPQLALNSLLELSPVRKQRIEKNIEAGIRRIKTFQNASGGLSYWPGMYGADDWSTSYAGHFMIEAQNYGYALPVNFLANWKKYQRSAALQWTSHEGSTDHVQAYRLYTLALAKAPELGAMNRLRELKNLGNAARWRLAAAYVLAGQKEIAAELIKNQPVNVKPYRELSMTYGSDLRDEAMILETLVLIGDRPKAFALSNVISKRMGSNEWFSTQTTAWTLLSVSRLAGKFSNNRAISFNYTMDGKTSSRTSGSRIVQIPVPVTGSRTGTVQINNTGQEMLYTRLIVKGQPEVGEMEDAAENLQMEVVYKDMQGNLLDPFRIEQGTDFKAEVSITNPGLLGDYDQMALSQIFASGWEIHNARMDNTAQATGGSVPTYQDIRDDRVYTYFNIGSREKKVFIIQLNASYLGRFYLPGVSCEAMYNAAIHANKGGMWVEVVPRQSKQPAMVSK